MVSLDWDKYKCPDCGNYDPDKIEISWASEEDYRKNPYCSCRE